MTVARSELNDEVLAVVYDYLHLIILHIISGIVSPIYLIASGYVGVKPST
jgi:hypothetical protein